MITTLVVLLVVAIALVIAGYVADAWRIWREDHEPVTNVVRRTKAQRAKFRFDQGRTAVRLARAGRELTRRHVARPGQFVLRTVRGKLAACVLGAQNWWAAQLLSWDALIAERPTFAIAFPMLARWWSALVLALRSPRVQLAAIALAVLTFGHSAGVFAMGPIRHLRGYDQLPTLNFTPATDAGKRIYLDLENNKATRYFQVRASATVDISVAVATAVRNLGLIESLWTEIGITGGGDGDIVRADPRILTFASEFMLVPSATPKDRLASTAIATTQCATQFRIWMENPQSVKPKETCLLQKEPNNKLQLFGTLNTLTTGAAASTIGAGAIVNAPAGSTITLTNVQLRVQQIVQTGLTELPLFRPRVTQINFPQAAVGNNIPLYVPVEANEYLRGITIMQMDTTTTEMIATGIASTGFSLIGDSFNYLGAGIKVTINDYARAQSFEGGGDLYGLYAERMVHYNFQQDGRLANLYNPGQDTNLRFLVDIQNACTLIVVKHSLMRDKYVSAEGRMIIAPKLPDELLDPTPAAA